MNEMAKGKIVRLSQDRQIYIRTRAQCDEVFSIAHNRATRL